ncbi:MAG TPA: hypothetical protein VF345_10950 [Chthoniobacterales bacterium]
MRAVEVGKGQLVRVPFSQERKDRPFVAVGNIDAIMIDDGGDQHYRKKREKKEKPIEPRVA